MKSDKKTKALFCSFLPHFPFICLSLLALTITSVSVHADLPADRSKVTIDNTRLKNVKGKLLNQTKKLVRNKIWDLFSDFEVYENNSEDLHISLKIERETDHNEHDNSYTVTDKITLPVSFPLFTTDLGKIASKVPVSFSAGVDLKLQVHNIRIVHPSSPLLTKENTENYKTVTAAKLAQEPKDLIQLTEYEEPKILGRKVTPKTYARYHNSLNRLAMAAKIPFKASTLKKLDDYEIVRYSAFGNVSFGPSLGYDYETLKIRFTAGIRRFYDAQFEISIMPTFEDNKRRAVVRQRLVSSKGYSFNVGGRYEEDIEEHDLEGDINSDHNPESNKRKSETGLLKGVNLNIIPINYNSRFSNGSRTEVIYSFDLENKEAVKAYEDMTLGKSETADLLFLRDQSMGDQAPVSRLLKIKSKFNNKNEQNKARYFIFKKIGKTCSNNLLEQEIFYPEGNYDNNIFLSNCQFKTESILNYDKLAIVSFSGGYHHNKENNQMTYGLSSAIRINNDNTSGWELNRYTSAINKIIGQNILPKRDIFKLVKFNKKKALEKNHNSIESLLKAHNGTYQEYQLIDYKHASINLNMKFSPQQILQFAQTPKKKMNVIIAKAFKNLSEAQLNDLEAESTYLASSNATKNMRSILGWAQKIATFPINLVNPNCKNFCKELHALAKFTNGWEELSLLFNTKNYKNFTDKDREEAITLFGREILNDPHYGYEYLTAIVLALKEADPNNVINYELSAFGGRFLPNGAINKSSGLTPIVPYDQYLTNLNYEKTLPFNDPSLAKNFDPEAIINSIEAGINKKYDAFIVNFSVQREPKIVRMTFIDAQGSTVAELKFKNENTANNGKPFKRLTNQYMQTIDYMISKTNRRLRRGNDYKVGLSISEDGVNFGPIVSSKKFSIPKK